jgi:hypothetical protein
MTNENMKYRFKMTEKQFNTLSEELQAMCVTTDDDKKPFAVERFLDSERIEADLKGMSEASVLALARKTHIGALQRAGREAVEIEFGLKAKSERFKQHDLKMYNEAKKTLDSLYASKALTDAGYASGLLTLKESFGVDQG